MSWIIRVRNLVRRFSDSKTIERDLDAEVKSFFDTMVERKIAQGLTRQDAERVARLEMGSAEQTKENVRDARVGASIDTIVRDVGYAMRSLRKAPGFALLAVGTLALGIGASTAVFTAIDAVVLRPLSYRDSGQLVVAWERVPFLGNDPVGPNPRHEDAWQKRADAFEGLTLLREGATGLAMGAEHPQMVGRVMAYTNLLSILRVEPLLGRDFAKEEGTAGHDRVAIITYAAWQNFFRGDPNAIGQTIRVGDDFRQIVGVLPASFHFPNANALQAIRLNQGETSALEPAIFVPAVLDLNEFSWNGEYGNWIALGRLKPGVSRQRAEAELMAIQAQLIREVPRSQGGGQPGSLLATVEPMQEVVVGGSRPGLWLLMAAVSGLMLIACLNLANAQLARALARDRDAAIRRALGASIGRLVWGSLCESLLLAVVGGAIGIVLALAGLNAFRRYAPLDLPRLAEVHVNLTVLLFAMALILGCSLLFGSLAALRFLRSDPQRALQQNSNRSLGSKQTGRLQMGLMGLQIFGCTVLLLMTGLFSKNLTRLLHYNRGFDTGDVTIAEVVLPRDQYAGDATRAAFNDGMLDELRAIGGVRSAAMVSAMPLEGESWIEGLQRKDKPNQEYPLFNLRWISPGYFETVRQPLIRGRFLEARDRDLRGAVLSEGEAKAVWGDEDPIGAQIKIENRTFQVVGVVADARSASLKASPPKMVYLHYQDRPPFRSFFVVRGSQPASVLTTQLREAIWKRAPNVTIARVKTFDAQMNDSLATEQFQTTVLIVFACAALLLAMLGIYGVLSYNIARRTQEIGVRMALGASRQSIYGLTLREAALPVLVGLAGGIGASALLVRAVRNLLYGMHGVDAGVMAATALTCLTAAALAAFVPARRAAIVDPMEALRLE